MKMERLQLVKCMEFICRNLNDENIFMGWLYDGVADGDIEYGDVAIKPEDTEDLMYYTEDKTFADLIDTFLRLMSRARKSGGLYCGGIAAGEYEESEKPFGVVCLYNEDIEQALHDEDFLVTEETVSKVRAACEADPHFTDAAVSAGWDAITNKIYELESKNWNN